jgi:hypothetical protein
MTVPAIGWLEVSAMVRNEASVRVIETPASLRGK